MPILWIIIGLVFLVIMIIIITGQRKKYIIQRNKLLRSINKEERFRGYAHETIILKTNNSVFGGKNSIKKILSKMEKQKLITAKRVIIPLSPHFASSHKQYKLTQRGKEVLNKQNKL